MVSHIGTLFRSIAFRYVAETLNFLTINDSGYYESESVNANDGKGDPESDPKVATHASDRGKRKVTGTSNRYFNRTLPMITTTIYPPIDNSVATSGAYPLKLATPQTIEVITDAARNNT